MAVCVVLAAASVARAAAAQQGGPWDYRDRSLSRQQLTQMLARYQAAMQSPAYSPELRTEAQRGADSINARLRDGDIRAGDRLRLRVEGQSQLSDTFAVSTGPALLLPVVGRVNLQGVLRDELEERIARSVVTVYRDATVHVELLTRVVVLGGVARPGFYSLPREALIDDAVTAAGGLTPDGRLSLAYIERGREQLWPPDSLQTAMRARRTIGDLGVQAGDRIVVPSVLPSDPLRVIQIATYLLSAPLSIYALIRLF